MIQLNLTDERYEEMKHLPLEEVVKRIELENRNKSDPLPESIDGTYLKVIDIGSKVFGKPPVEYMGSVWSIEEGKIFVSKQVETVLIRLYVSLGLYMNFFMLFRKGKDNHISFRIVNERKIVLHGKMLEFVTLVRDLGTRMMLSSWKDHMI